MGYCGGQQADPTYHHLGDHSETVQVDFDPTRISYVQLLDIFFTSHSCGAPWSRQYRSAIFFADAGQKRAALDALLRHGERQQRELHVDIEPLHRFYLAEDYHQKYYLRQSSVLAAEFARIYPDEADFVNSTAVARANAACGGGLRKTALERTLPELGLSEGAAAELRRVAR